MLSVYAGSGSSSNIRNTGVVFAQVVGINSVAYLAIC
jgi:hypothetical protein